MLRKRLFAFLIAFSMIAVQTQYSFNKVFAAKSDTSSKVTKEFNIIPAENTFSSKNPQDLILIATLSDGINLVNLNISSASSTIEDTKLQKDKDYKFSGSAITVNKEFLKTLKNGNYVLTVYTSHGTALTSKITVTDTVIPQNLNLIKNYGFELINGSLSGWTKSNNIIIDKNEKYEGEQSICVSKTVSSPALVKSDYIEVTPYSTYQISMNYKSQNSNQAPFIQVDYYNSGKSRINTTKAEGLSTSEGWSAIYDERVMPSSAKYIRLTAGAVTGSGKVWFDNANVNKNNYLLNSSFKDGDTSPYYWNTDNEKTNGKLEWLKDNIYSNGGAVKLIKNSGDKIILNSSIMPVMQNAPYGLTVRYRHKGGNIAALVKINWYDKFGNPLAVSTNQANIENMVLSYSSEMTAVTKRFTAPENSAYAVAALNFKDGSGSIIIDDIELRNTLTSGFGEIVPVYGVENISEPMTPHDFWSKFPKIPLKAPKDSVWTIAPLRNFFFGVTQNVNDFINFSVLSTDRFDNIPASDKTIGVDGTASGPYYVTAKDIKFNPIVSRYSGYTNVYYPRRIHDYMLTDYLPLYAVTGKQKYLDRSKDLMNFMMYEQWKENGTNEFIKDCFPLMSAVKHLDWSGGWDDQFNFTWTDAYGYKWTPSEPDTHVNAQMANAAITAYQQTKDTRYLNSVKKFLNLMLPRYGFHKGIWNNKVYYWTEYGPTGSSKGITSDDATDNVNALIASALAEYAYYEKDPATKAKYLEFSRGLIWYLARELQYDKRFYYDGMENGIGERKAISHDLVVLNCSAMAITYMYKSGVDVSDLIKFYENAQGIYRDTWSVYQKMRYFRMFKLYDGTPAANKPITFTTFANVIDKDLVDVKFKDNFSSEDFVVPKTIDLRISEILNPDDKNSDWRTNSSNDVVLRVTPEELKSGVIVPFTMKNGYIYKFSYELTAANNFDRNKAVDFDSELFTWSKDSNNDAYFIRCTTGNVGDSTKYCLIPLKMENRVNSTNFLSFAARYLFAFDKEVNAKLVETNAPQFKEYKNNENWGNVKANRYIYLVQSLTPNSLNSGKSLVADGFVPNRGKVYSSTAVNDFVEFKFENYLPDGKFKISTNYATANNRGIVRMSIDGKTQGTDTDTYATPQPKYQQSPIVITKNFGNITLNKGEHTLRFTVTGKNKNAVDYNIGISDALILTPIK